jgi:hypothetical protein
VTPTASELRWCTEQQCVELSLRCYGPTAEVTLRESGASRFRHSGHVASRPQCSSRPPAASRQPPEQRAMACRVVAMSRRAAEPCQSASCPALIPLIDRRGKQFALLRPKRLPACVHVTRRRWDTAVRNRVTAGRRFEQGARVDEGRVLGYNPQFVPHSRHITSPLQSTASKCYVRFEVFAAVAMNSTVFGMLRRLDLVRTDVSEEHIASIIRVTRIGELRTTLAEASNQNFFAEYIGCYC